MMRTNQDHNSGLPEDSGLPKNPGLDDWDACSQGELTQMVTRLDAAKRRANRNRSYGSTLVCTALFAVVAFSVGSLLDSGGHLFGGIRCAECKSNFEAYHGHLTEASLIADAKLLASMETHLAKCAVCRDRFNRTYPGILPGDLSASSLRNGSLNYGSLCSGRAQALRLMAPDGSRRSAKTIICFASGP